MDWAQLEAHIDAGAYADALALAVAGWRERRCAPYADLVDAIAAKAPRGRRLPAVKMHDYDRRDRARRPDDPWAAAAAGASPAELGGLLGSLARVPETGRAYLDPVKRRHVAWFDRLAALAGRPADPRIATALVAALRDARLTVIDAGEARAVYAPAIALLGELADERAIAPLRALVEHPIAKRASVREVLAEALPAVTIATATPLRDADATRCAALIGKLAPRRERHAAAPRRIDDADLVDQIVGQIVANLADDGPREVLADHLIERGDPRGELIALQLRGGVPGRGLVRKVDALLGDLARVTKNRVYVRGFLDEIELQNNAAAAETVWAAAAASPLLATVRQVLKGAANEALYRAFAGSPQARSLARLVTVSKAMLAEACARAAPWPIRELEMAHAVDRASLAAVARSQVLPQLAHLSFFVRGPAILRKLFRTRDGIAVRAGRVDIRGDVRAVLARNLA